MCLFVASLLERGRKLMQEERMLFIRTSGSVAEVDVSILKLGSVAVLKLKRRLGTYQKLAGGRRAGVENGVGSKLFEPPKRKDHEEIGSAKGRVTNLHSCNHKEHCVLML